MLLDPDKMQALEGWRENNPVGRVCLKDEEALTEATAFLRQHSILDEAQLQAVLAALTEELVLIQGVLQCVCCIVLSALNSPSPHCASAYQLHMYV